MEYELDYVQEAERARAFSNAVRPFSDLKVPEVVSSHTSKKVMTMEWLQGKVLKDFLAENPENDERFRVTRLLIRAIYGPFLFSGQMHADPHPGNFMVLPDGRMGILDFGSIKQFSSAFVGANLKVFQSAIENRRIDLVSVLRELGTTIELPEEEADALIWELLQLIGRPLSVDLYDFSKDKTIQDAQKFFKENAIKMLKLRPPPEAVMFFRATGGLQQNLRLLGAAGDFKTVYREMGEDALRLR
jgi:predicted unusual protein kinase regulating ubiquinone biosynthesis (AarF/ABC1/UbiB family)